MHYSVCRTCKRSKASHSLAELKVCSAKTKVETRDIIREPKEVHVIIPDPLSDRKAGRFRW